MFTKNYLQEKMKTGRPVLGTWNTIDSFLVTEILARTGLDFLIIDMEHGPFRLGDTHLYVDKCEAYGCSPLVRLPTNSDWMILQALDQGAHGVVVPHVDSREDAERVAHSVKYHPRGARGYTPFTKAGGFTNHGSQGYSESANNLSVAAVIIESERGIKNLDDILSVDGIDIVYFGAYDLSQSLGIIGDVKHESMRKLITDAVGRVRKAGKYAGGYVPQSPEEIDWLLKIGMQFVTYQVDSSALYEPIARAVNWLSERHITE